MLQKKLALSAIGLLAAGSIGGTADAVDLNNSIEMAPASVACSINVLNEDNNNYSFETQDGTLMRYDFETQTMMQSTDGGKSWNEIEDNTFVRLETEDDFPFELGEDVIICFDDVTEELTQSTDGGKTWTALDGEVEIAIEEAHGDGAFIKVKPYTNQ